MTTLENLLHRPKSLAEIDQHIDGIRRGMDTHELSDPAQFTLADLLEDRRKLLLAQLQSSRPTQPTQKPAGARN